MDMDFNLFRQVADSATDERNVAARFYDKAVKTDQLTSGGLPIFKNVTYVEIRLKDNTTEVFNQPATPEKIRRFPREYALYCQAKENVKDGTPINQFAFLTAAEVATCHNRGIWTVEALAALSPEKALDLGLTKEVETAQLFLQTAKDNRFLSHLAGKEKEYLNQIAELQRQVTELKKQVEMSKGQKKYFPRRGNYKGGNK